ncbi:hypothetical protein [Streptomyces sp. NPDC056672]|uniref:hypothetical protein n=1 Tax=Streptomyces sp. NPDC056672 TaxID=3345906 RepID=UPI0036A28368
MITAIMNNATDAQLQGAVNWTSDHLHVPLDQVTECVAVAYVVRHFQMGALSGWDGFIRDLKD